MLLRVKFTRCPLLHLWFLYIYIYVYVCPFFIIIIIIFLCLFCMLNSCVISLFQLMSGLLAVSWLKWSEVAFCSQAQIVSLPELHTVVVRVRVRVRVCVCPACYGPPLPGSFPRPLRIYPVMLLWLLGKYALFKKDILCLQSFLKPCFGD